MSKRPKSKKQKTLVQKRIEQFDRDGIVVMSLDEPIQDVHDTLRAIFGD